MSYLPYMLGGAAVGLAARGRSHPLDRVMQEDIPLLVSRAREEGYVDIGVRSSDDLTEEHSWRWDDGGYTEEELPGLSATSIEARDWRALHRPHGTYLGTYLVLLAGINAHWGEDPGELVIFPEHRIILGAWEKSTGKRVR